MPNKGAECKGKTRPFYDGALQLEFSFQCRLERTAENNPAFAVEPAQIRTNRDQGHTPRRQEVALLSCLDKVSGDVGAIAG